ncbi:electron transport complex subunit RsxC [Methyloversatilis sp.]|uniref:electron transport complex subunit RsxC n=1 Tax=Methyloversatilis sp. TaxID=2569862 RepID=UPI0027344DCB|nr:electron transport complex subunit RsxC [Methyloversatilis sp.]MDP2867337.1 electron transport complex subunit RsxC [Methyloversatilis sp.]MDP3456961.1 electron transport complex subunit RsxC [Methyloversatilis sp.]MDP3579923.1 electron transport complex subunit RsxC [Methyloversatilis sp.]
MLNKLFSFNGGVKPDPNKSASTREPIARLALPPQLVIPLHQHIGGTPRPLVTVGSTVLGGQRIGAPDGNVSSAVHAPTSGRVVAIEPRPMPHASGLSSPAVVIEPDGLDTAIEREPFDWHAAAPGEIRDFLRDAGVVGLGGAVFPSHLKLNPGKSGHTDTLVINGAECEPFITCDDMLMRTEPENILRGALIMQRMLAAKQVLVALEDNKPEAATALKAAARALGNASLEVVVVPTRYPAGGAKQLIRVLTGIEVPHGSRSTDFGVQCFNVATALAVWRALEHGEALTRRIVTVAGNVERPRNFDVAIGTPISHLFAAAGLKPDTDKLIMGGPMMGIPLPNIDAPVVKATNCLLASSPTLFAPPEPELPCIRCGECARACPADLQPFELYWHSRARNFGRAQEYKLFDCIECGCCAYVCPSHIPLVDYYRYAKSEIWARERDKDAADSARERFEFRNWRADREKEEKAAKLAARNAAKPAVKPADGPAPAADVAPAAAEDPKKALIEAAMARARAQKEAVAAKNTDALTPAQKAQIDAAEERRKRASELSGSDAPTE